MDDWFPVADDNFPVADDWFHVGFMLLMTGSLLLLTPAGQYSPQRLWSTPKGRRTSGPPKPREEGPRMVRPS